MRPSLRRWPPALPPNNGWKRALAFVASAVERNLPCPLYTVRSMTSFRVVAHWPLPATSSAMQWCSTWRRAAAERRPAGRHVSAS